MFLFSTYTKCSLFVTIDTSFAPLREEMSPADSAVTLDSRYLTRSGDKKDSQKASVNRRVWLKTVAVLIRNGRSYHCDCHGTGCALI